MKIASLCVLLIVILLGGCANRADDRDRELTNNQQEIYQVKQPLPFYDYSHERNMVTQIYNARNKALNTWSVWRSEGTGKVEDWCPSIGFGIPYDTSLTNPLKTAYRHSSTTTVEQAEPNGLFSSKTTKATWVLCQLPNGDIAPVYIESTVTVYPWPIRVENDEIVHLYDKGASITIDTSKPQGSD